MLRRNFFDVWFANPKESIIGSLFSYILQELGAPFLSEDSLKTLKIIIRRVIQKFEQKWSKLHSNSERFLKANSWWLDECISFSDIATGSIDTISNPGPGRRTDRLQKDFESCRIQHILETSSQEEISMEAEVLFRREGKRDSAAIANKLGLFSRRRDTTIKKSEEAFLKPKQRGLSEDLFVFMLCLLALWSKQICLHVNIM
ncbi:hypothetical protein AVEN_268275-1 [Araneus ventricosus]|uniref:Uncharacterized protein n=1 Tax=Araneus ventricosus TaxID=182803 RepID=A0A4Y2C247_ARAVE|nr:hypothetical protein AVEN_268275-1 [Araneus ventricosus]